MQDTNLNLNLIGFLTQDTQYGNIDNWRHFHQCLQPEGYSGQLKNSSYNEQANEFKYLIERDNQVLMNKVSKTFEHITTDMKDRLDDPQALLKQL